MAKGSHSTYGGWEPRVCHSCGRKLTLNDAAMSTHPADRPPFDLCNPCIHTYGDAYADMEPLTAGDHTDQPEQYACTSQDLHPYECDGPGHCIHCDQLTLEEAQP